MKNKLFIIIIVSFLFILPKSAFAEEKSTSSVNNNIKETGSYTLELPSTIKKVEVKKKVKLSIIKKYKDGSKENVESEVDWASSNNAIATVNNNELSTKKLGKITLKATYKGETKSFKINIVDTQKPILTGVSNKTVNLNSKFSAKLGVKAKDNYDGNITKKVTVKGSVNTKKVGKYTLTYSVKDSSGNKTVAKRIITVKKTIESNFRTSKEGNYKFYVHKNISDSNLKQIYKNTFVLIPATDKTVKIMGVEAYTGNLKVKKVKIESNGKKLALKFQNGAAFLNDKEIKFFKDNVSTKQTVKVIFTNTQKNVTKKLSKKEIIALTDAVKLYNKW